MEKQSEKILISGKSAQKKEKTIPEEWTTVESGHGVVLESLLLLLPRTFSFRPCLFIGCHMGGWLVGWLVGWSVIH